MTTDDSASIHWIYFFFQHFSQFPAQLLHTRAAFPYAFNKVHQEGFLRLFLHYKLSNFTSDTVQILLGNFKYSVDDWIIITQRYPSG